MGEGAVAVLIEGFRDILGARFPPPLADALLTEKRAKKPLLRIAFDGALKPAFRLFALTLSSKKIAEECLQCRRGTPGKLCFHQGNGLIASSILLEAEGLEDQAARGVGLVTVLEGLLKLSAMKGVPTLAELTHNGRHLGQV